MKPFNKILVLVIRECDKLHTMNTPRMFMKSLLVIFLHSMLEDLHKKNEGCENQFHFFLIPKKPPGL